MPCNQQLAGGKRGTAAHLHARGGILPLRRAAGRGVLVHRAVVDAQEVLAPERLEHLHALQFAPIKGDALGLTQAQAWPNQQPCPCCKADTAAGAQGAPNPKAPRAPAAQCDASTFVSVLSRAPRYIDSPVLALDGATAKARARLDSTWPPWLSCWLTHSQCRLLSTNTHALHACRPGRQTGDSV